MKNWQLRFGLAYLKVVRFFRGDAYMCPHHLIPGMYLHKGKTFNRQCGICKTFYNEPD